MSTRDITIQQMLLNQVIYSRKASIDQFYEGLCVLRFNELLVNFPQAFELLFISQEESLLTPSSLLESMQLIRQRDSDNITLSLFKEYVLGLSLEGR